MSRPGPVSTAWWLAAALFVGTSTAAVAQEPEPLPPTWVEALHDLQFYGDLRLRHESDLERDGRSDRHRERLRLRFGANYQASDQLLFGTRVVTGDPDDPNSPHVTFGDAFDDLELSLDRAFLTYRPESWPGLELTGGKFAQPLYRNEVYGELVWDADVHPEGGVLRQRWSGVGPLESLDLTLGGYVVLEQGDADDATAWVAQAVGRRRLGENVQSTVAIGYYGYDHTTPDGATDLLDDNAGNAVVGDEFVSDFGILDAIVGVTYEGGARPLTFSGQYVENRRAEIDRDQGWAVGVAYGTTAAQGDWRAYYQYQLIEQDSVFSPFAQDDFLLATNHSSHVFGVNYQLTGDVGLHLWGLVSARDETSPGPTTDSDSDQWRLRLDLNMKF